MGGERTPSELALASAQAEVWANHGVSGDDLAGRFRMDRMKDYPEDLRKWVVDSKAEAEALYAQVKSKR